MGVFTGKKSFQIPPKVAKYPEAGKISAEIIERIYYMDIDHRPTSIKERGMRMQTQHKELLKCSQIEFSKYQQP